MTASQGIKSYLKGRIWENLTELKQPNQDQELLPPKPVSEKVLKFYSWRFYSKNCQKKRKNSSLLLTKVNGVFCLDATIVYCCSVAKLCLTLWPHGCSAPGFTVLHYLLEFAQTHVHWVSDAIQPSHPLSSPSPPALNLSQHQNLFQWVCPSCQMVKILKLQHHSIVISVKSPWIVLIANKSGESM